MLTITELNKILAAIEKEIENENGIVLIPVSFRMGNQKTVVRYGNGWKAEIRGDRVKIWTKEGKHPDPVWDVYQINRYTFWDEERVFISGTV